jgi:hypothetical protein
MPKATIEIVTTEMAAELLKLNIRNFRALSKHRVDAMAEDIRQGNWEMNGESIKVNGDVLLDGQHRLTAIIRADRSIKTVVVRDCQSDGSTIDRGQRRTMGQVVCSKGLKNGCALAAVGRMCVLYKKGLWGKSHVQLRDVLDSDQLEYISDHEGNLQECIRISAMAKKIAPASCLATVLHFGCKLIDVTASTTADWFVLALGKGEMINKGDAVYHLRNRLIGQTKQAPLTSYMKRVLITMAWNKTVRGETCTSNALRLRNTGPSRTQPPEQIEAIQPGQEDEQSY